MVNYAKVRITCRWCNETFDVEISSTDGARSQVVCPKCRRTLPSSIKEKIEDKTSGKSHIHKPYPSPPKLEKLREKFK